MSAVLLAVRSLSRVLPALLLALLALPLTGLAQPVEALDLAEGAAEASESVVAGSVAVAPVAADGDISSRLTRILTATAWFEAPAVRVDEGVVFLSGTADTVQHQEWARDLARNTEGVVAVVNRISVARGDMWDFSPAWDEVRRIGAEAVRRSPLLLLSLLLLALAVGSSMWLAGAARSLLALRIENQLLRNVLSRAVAVPIFLLGLYIVLRISGLTGLAATVLGGTGLVGLIIGFAFRDIAENFLASMLISVQNPFATGDRIAVAGYDGFVQSVNARSTLLMTLDGNHVQIPNATIYKETIVNFSANPNTRFDFGVGIGYSDTIAAAQALAKSVAQQHAGVLQDPDPLVLVDALGSATVNLRVYFWVNTSVHSGLKVRSAVIRTVKQAFDEAGVSMPDEAREVVFPNGVPVHMTETAPPTPVEQPKEGGESLALEGQARDAEGDLASESVEIEQQAQNSRVPEGGSNLLGD